MNDNNIVVASFPDGKKEAITQRMYQYDYGMILRIEGLELPQAFEAHFSNVEDGEAKTQIGTDDEVIIPDEYFLTGLPIFCWIYLHTGLDDGETVYRIKIPMRERSEPTDLQPTPVQQDAITQAIAALDAAVVQTSEDADDAHASAILAESWAVGGTDTRQGEDNDNAKHYAEVAAQNADASGYVWFYVNEDDGEAYVEIANNLDNDLSYHVNEQTGELEVVIK